MFAQPTLLNYTRYQLSSDFYNLYEASRGELNPTIHENLCNLCNLRIKKEEENGKQK